MTTPDYKALCAELTDIVTAHASPDDDAVGYVAAVLTRARDALAAEPEPSNYIDSEHTGQDRELLEIFYAACQAEGGTADEIHLRGIRTVLAATEPAPPADGEVAEFVAQLRRYAKEDTPFRLVPSMVARAADLLSRLAPQPVPEGPTNQEIEEWAAASRVPREFLDPDSGRWERCFTSVKFCATIRAALEEWGTPNLAQTRSSLGDGPAVPSGREPASVSEELTDEDIMALMPQRVPEKPSDEDLLAVGDEDFRANCWPTDAIRFARAVLDRWGSAN